MPWTQQNVDDMFRPTPLREGRQWRTQPGAINSRFRLTPLREGRRRPADVSGAGPTFRLTPLREGRLVLLSRCVFATLF